MRRLLPVALVLLVLVAFGRATSAQFTNYDDNLNIYDNPAIRDFSAAKLATLWTQWRTGYEGMYIPLTYSVWGILAALSIQFSGVLEPSLFHTANLVLHATAAIFVYLLLRRLIRRLDAVADAWPADVAAAFGAALFALHPIQCEPVGWATGLKDILSSCLALAAIHQHITFAEARSPLRRAAHYAACAALLLLAMLAKPSVIVVPVLLGAIQFLLPPRSPAGARPTSRKSLAIALLSTLPLALLATPLILIARQVQSDAGAVIHVAWPARFVVALDALGFYAYKILVPWRYAIDYGRSPAVVLHSRTTFATIALAVALLGGASFALFRRRPHWALAVALFVIAPLPVLGLVPFEFQDISTVADRYAYLAMLGPAFAAAALIAIAQPTRRIYLAATGITAALALLSAAQIGAWQTSITLARASLDVNPQSWLAWSSLGHALDARADFAGAIDAYEHGIAVAPDQPILRRLYRNTLDHAGRPADARVQNIHLIRADALWHLRATPNNPAAQLQLAGALARLGDEAGARRWLSALPPSAFATSNPDNAARLAEISFCEGILAHRHSDFAAAIEHYRQALQLAPQNAEYQAALRDAEASRQIQ